MCLDPSGKFLATGSVNSLIRIYDITKGFTTHNFKTHRDPIIKLYFHPDP